MPFTASHAAAVVPFILLRHPKISGPALVAGAMAPDFEYFLRAKMYGVFGHTVFGLFAFCLPVGVALVALYQALLLEPLALAAPARVRAKLLSSRMTWTVKKLSIVCACVLFGAATHIVWDSATHANRILAPTELVFGTPLFRWLQHVSTIVGGVVVATVLLSKSTPVPIEAGEQTRARLTFAATIPLGSLVVATGRAWVGPDNGGTIIVASISGAILGTIVGALAIRLSHSRSQPSGRRPTPEDM